MRIYAAVVVVLLLVLSFSFITLNKLESSANDMVAGLGGMEMAIAGDNWEYAGTGIAKVENLWNEHKSWWAMVIDHQEIDNISMSLARIKHYISMQDRVMASSELAVLKQLLVHIPEKEKVNLENIF
ncbi:DUF4363 family protein [Desulfoscipio gibsoniae]|uniref:DUF4363 family protein n=1 Tax=Desulfoscipio gibsoniae DSM 7213 TaxID=767817 RepID=R4KR83_9FIRM|nr:DUF4363 family protein [Desulfoscipio gibsoniae]AGL03075.1 hypothetical protein Desgi_3753 [Desulfoscipio gibsoniae DSM 7213]